jgi:ubiquinone/menaquinone biosynthesis C-methylase UbiE
MSSAPRVDYDAVAPLLYDRQRYRNKEADRHLMAFVQHRDFMLTSTLAVLDIGCGTGSQLVANRFHVGSGVYMFAVAC